MSAWIVSTAHVDVLVKGMVENNIIEAEDATEVGNDLVEECVLSVQYRYGGESRATLPGSYHEKGQYEYREPGVELSPVQFNAAAGCYAYQTCEHPTWEQSDAFTRIERLLDVTPTCHGNSTTVHEDRLLKADEVPWGFYEDQVHPRQVVA